MGLLAAALLAVTLHVRVLDPSGALVGGAAVTARAGAGSGAEIHAVTDRSGEVAFTLAAGTYALVVEAVGFEPTVVPDVDVAGTRARLDVPLRLARRQEQLDVDEPSDRGRGRSASNVLGEADVAALPDDPDEMEDALRHMAGPGALIRVNGFGGGRLPPKSQIRQIRISMGAYAAEYHEGGRPRVDILTKPGLGSWRRGGAFALRDAGLNAADPLSGRRGPGDLQRFGLTLDGPLQREKTSLSLTIEGRHAQDPRAIVATVPRGGGESFAVQTLDRLDAAARLEHAWGAHTLRGEYQRSGRDQDGLGAGGLDLAERAYRQEETEHLFRATATGVVAGRLANQARVQLRWQDVSWTPRSTAPGVQVAGAFTSGGAGVAGTRRAAELELADDVDWSRGRHAFRAGLLLEGTHRRGGQERNGNGTFLFPSLQAYELGRPALFSLREHGAPVAFGEWRLGLYLQDDIRVGARLSLNAGLRLERHSLVPDGSNLAPRGGLAWSATSDLTVRAGGGLFFEWLGADVYEQAVRLDGEHEREWIVSAPGYPDPLAGGTIAVPPTGQVRLDQALRLAEVWRAEVGLERSVGVRGRLGASYVFERGGRLPRARNVNALADGARPDSLVGNVAQVEATGTSRRHALRLNAHYGMPGTRVSAVAFYLFGRATDDADTPLALPADPGNLAAERGPAADDRRHRAFALASLRPGHGLRLTAMVRAESGPPYDITSGGDDNRDTVANDRPAGITRNQGRGQGLLDLGLRVSWTVAFGERKTPVSPPGPRVMRFDPASDDAPPELGMPGDENKRFRVTSYLHAFNLLNRPNPSAFNRVFGSPTFGQPTAGAVARRIEAGLTLGF